MKRRIALTTTLTLALLCLFVGAAPAMAQDCPGCEPAVRPAAAAPPILSAGATYTTDTDNENNTHTGSSDGDMGGLSAPCVFETYSNAPIEFNINVSGALPTSNAILSLYVYDVDEDGTPPPEVDEVYFNGNLVGTLTGANDAWSTSVFPLDIGDVQAGNNLVEIQIDTAAGSYGRWCVALAWGQLLIDGGTGEAEISSVVHDPCYETGLRVQIDIAFTIDVISSGNYRLETNVVDPSNVTIHSDIYNFAGTAGSPVQHTVTLYLSEPATEGVYTINANLFDDDTEILQNVALSTFEWAEVCEEPVPTPTPTQEPEPEPEPLEYVPEPGTMLLLGSGLAGLAGFATLRWRTRK